MALHDSSFEFVCQDCGVLVVSFCRQHANDDDVCAECSWIREALRSIDDPTEREKFRAFFEQRRV